MEEDEKDGRNSSHSDSFCTALWKVAWCCFVVAVVQRVTGKEERTCNYLSFTEEEVREGLEKLPMNDRRCKVVILNRTFEHVPKRQLSRRQSSSIVSKYFDVTAAGRLDSESRRRWLMDVQQKLVAMVPDTNVKNYTVCFRTLSRSAIDDDGDELVRASREYLKQFSDDFCQSFVDSIDDIATSQKIAGDAAVQIHLNGVNHHASYVVARASGYAFTESATAVYDGTVSRISKEGQPTLVFRDKKKASRQCCPMSILGYFLLFIDDAIPSFEFMRPTGARVRPSISR